LKQQGNLSAAERALRTGITFDPDNPGAYNSLGQVLRAEGQLDESRLAFAKGARAEQHQRHELGSMLSQKATMTTVIAVQ
jgi:Flp pilus assembly protein TadD